MTILCCPLAFQRLISFGCKFVLVIGVNAGVGEGSGIGVLAAGEPSYKLQRFQGYYMFMTVMRFRHVGLLIVAEDFDIHLNFINRSEGC